MEAQKIVHLLNATDNEQESSVLFFTKITQNMVKEMKMILALNSRQKLSNQIFVIIQMHKFL